MMILPPRRHRMESRGPGREGGRAPRWPSRSRAHREDPMPLPDGRPLVVADGILLEPSPEGLLILWLPGERGGGYQHWERVAPLARSTVTTERGVRSIAATSVPARQRLGG